MSHTPGPWKFEVVDETDSLLGCKRLNGGNGSTVIDLSDEWTGYPECGQDLQMTISKDDAALIAAAPEMLEALEELGLTTEQVKDGIIQMEFAHNHERSGVIEYMVARLQDCMSEKKEAQRAAGRLKDQYENVSKHYSRRGGDIERLEAEKAEMLRALEAVTGDSEESDYMTQAQIQGLCRAAIKKARGVE